MVMENGEYPNDGERPTHREDCDPQCEGYTGARPCCGGCPASCYCRLEAEQEAIAEREDEAEREFFETEDWASEDSFAEYQQAKREGAF